MNMINEDRVLAPHWGWFRRIWMVVTIVLFVLLVVLWLLGVGPGGRRCSRGDCGDAVAVAVPSSSGDIQAPNLSLEGDNPVFLRQGQPYTEPGVSASDDVDGDVAVGSSGVVDGNTPGHYTLTYTATDRAGNTSTLTRKVIVEADGNASAMTAAAPAPGLPLARLYFALGSAQSPTDSGDTLADVARYLSDHPEAKAVISGFHDASGDMAVNQSLAKSRAETVRTLLIEHGVAADRIDLEKPQETQGTGGADEARRVEVSIRP